MSKIKISSKVICINGQFDSSVNNFILFKPQIDQIYTIREIIDTPNGQGFLLEELVNKPVKFRNKIAEPCFLINRFRPIDEIGKKSDIYHFAKLNQDVLN